MGPHSNLCKTKICWYWGSALKIDEPHFPLGKFLCASLQLLSLAFYLPRMHQGILIYYWCGFFVSSFLPSYFRSFFVPSSIPLSICSSFFTCFFLCPYIFTSQKSKVTFSCWKLGPGGLKIYCSYSASNRVKYILLCNSLSTGKICFGSSVLFSLDFEKFRKCFNFVFYIIWECISCGADTHMATDLTSQDYISLINLKTASLHFLSEQYSDSSGCPISWHQTFLHPNLPI